MRSGTRDQEPIPQGHQSKAWGETLRDLISIQRLVIGVALFASALPALAADNVTLTGVATGSFNNGLTSIDGLSFTGSTFDVTSSNGYYAIGGSAGSPNVNNLGSFTLTGTPANYNGDTFSLDVTFTSPTGIADSNEASFSSLLFGTVSSNRSGGVFVDFSPAPQDFSFSNASGSGMFSLAVNTMSITSGFTSPVTGSGKASIVPVPEPSSFLLIAGLLGSGIIRRGRKSAV